MKEIPNGSKNRWSRIWKKKWFFPALYLIAATLLLAGVVIYQQTGKELPESFEDVEEKSSFDPQLYDDEAESVLQHQEIIKMPVSEEVQSEVVTKFYEYEADKEDQEKSLTLYNNRYYQSTGVNIAAADGESFDVVASLSGTVEEVREDPLLGNIVTLAHGDDITTYYASLADVTVEEGDEVKQGEKVGTAGKNLFDEESGIHVHFEIRKNGIEVNPENFFNVPLMKLIDYEIDLEEDEDTTTEEDTEMTDEEDKDKNRSENDDENEELSESRSSEPTDAMKEVAFSTTV